MISHASYTSLSFDLNWPVVPLVVAPDSLAGDVGALRDTIVFELWPCPVPASDPVLVDLIDLVVDCVEGVAASVSGGEEVGGEVALAPPPCSESRFFCAICA